jgi:hypothetical protein
MVFVFSQTLGDYPVQLHLQYWCKAIESHFWRISGNLLYQNIHGIFAVERRIALQMFQTKHSPKSKCRCAGRAVSPRACSGLI